MCCVPLDLHSYKQRLSGGEAGRGVLLHQRQRVEPKLVDGLVGVQRREVGVHLAVVLGDVEAVGVHVLAAETRRVGNVRRTKRKGRVPKGVSPLT